MKKSMVTTAALLLSLAAHSIAPWGGSPVEAAPAVAKYYYSKDGNDYYGFPVKQYIYTYASPSGNAKVTGKIKRNGAFLIDAKMANGWYRLNWNSANTYDYIRPGDITLVRENEVGNYAEPVYPFPNVNLSAPAPKIKVPAISVKPTDHVPDNLNVIAETLGFEKKIDVSGIEYYYYAPNGVIARNAGRAALEFHRVPGIEPQDTYETRLLIRGWGKSDLSAGEVEKVPAAVREILKFYYPTGYSKIYSMLYKGYETGADMDEFMDTMFVFDNREFRVEAYREGAEVGLYIGKEGLRYTNSFWLPNNVALVKVNGKRLITDQPAVIQNGSTMVPLRGIFEALGASVKWDQKTQTITAVKGNRKISLTAGKKTASANGTAVKLDAAPQVSGGTTLVPLRFISQSLGASVKWDKGQRTVWIENEK